MLNINEWRLLKESIGSGMTLGLSRPTTVGGPIGSHFTEEEFSAKDADFDDDEDEDEDEDDEEYDGEQLEDEDEDGDGGLEGDLVGSSSEDEGPDKDFPPDDSEEADGLPTPDEEQLGDDDFSDGPADFGGDDEFGGLGGDFGGDDEFGDFGGDEFGGDDLAGLDDLGGLEDMGAEPATPEDMLGGDDLAGDLAGGMGDAPMGGDEGDGMDFLNDIDPGMAGLGGEEDGLDGLDGLDDAGGEEPCPDCNMDGTEEQGDPDCPTCDGLGFVPSEEHGDPLGDDLGGLEDDLGGLGEEEPGLDKMMSYQRKFMHKDKDREHCNCEHDEFLGSLAKNAKNPAKTRNKTGLEEDALFSLVSPEEMQTPEAQPGSVGFAPSGRIGGIGGGYTKDDFADLPVLGESTNHRARRPRQNKYPTLTEWAQAKATLKKQAKKRR